MTISADTVFGAIVGVVGTLLLAYPIAFMARRAEKHAEKSLSEHLGKFALSKWARRLIGLAQLGLVASAAWIIWNLQPSEAAATRADVIKALGAGFGLSAVLASRIAIMTIDGIGGIMERFFRVFSELSDTKAHTSPEESQ